MKKRILALLLGMLMVIGLLAACGGDDSGSSNAGTSDGGSTDSATTDSGTTDSVVKDESLPTIEFWSFTDELPNEVMRYVSENPDFPYNVNVTIISDQDGAYEQALNAALLAGGDSAPDAYVLEQAFVVNYTKFDFASFALPYAELFGGVDTLNQMIADADISSMIQDAGTNLDGQLVALGYQSTGSALIYRRSIAEAVWGTDDPDFVGDKVKGWSGFAAAAAEVAEAGYAMVAGEGDIWQAIRQSPEQWIKDGKLVIDDQRMSFIDIGYEFYNNGYSLKASAWGDAWNAGMGGQTDPEVFCYLGPAWLINYVMAPAAGDTFGDWAICPPPEPFAWGGSYTVVNAQGNPEVREGVAELVKWITLDATPNGLQYTWAAGDTVASGTVMSQVDGTWEFLGGQNAFDVFVPMGAYGSASGWGPYDRSINDAFIQHMNQYFAGEVTKDEAIDNFKQEILDVLGIES